jgi:WD40 repeat protein
MAAHADDLIVVATDCGRIQVWDPATGVACRYLPDVVPGLTGPTVRVRSVAADPSGTWLAASVDGRLLVWDVADPKEPLLAAGLPCPAEVTALAFDSTGWRLATGDKVGKVRVWDLAELAVAAPVNSAPGAAAFDGAPLETVSVSMPGTLPGASQPPSGSVLALAWDHTRNRWLNVSKTGPNGSVNGVGTANLGVAGVSLRAAALSPDGRFTAMIDDVKGRVYLAGMDDAARLRILDGTDRVITGVAFTESGRLALGCSDGRLLLWHRSEPSMKVIRPEGTPVTGVAASPNGSQVVISDKTSELKSFTEVKNSLKPGWVADSAEPEECLAFQADGTLLASAGDAVRTWNAANGTQAGVLPGRTGRVRESRLTTTASG